MSFKKLVSSSICIVVLCAAVSAQETKPNLSALSQRENANEVTNKMSSQATVTPQQLAACWALDNQEEVILAKFAQEKTKNKDVTQFAKMIAEQHQACLKKLSKFAPEASREGYLVSDQPSSRNEATSPAGRSNDQATKTNDRVATNSSANTHANGASAIDMMQLQREIAQQCIADSKKYLNAKEGDEFDKTFVGMQIAKHAAMRTKLTVLQRHTTDQMREMVTEGIQATEKHLKAAEDLMHKLDVSESTSSTNAKK